MKKVFVILILISLLASGCARKKSTLILTSSPQGADVYINDELIGKTPLSKDMAEGEYKIIFKMQGFNDFERDISVGRNSGDVSVNAELEQIESYVVNFDFESHFAIFIDDKFMGKVTPESINDVSPGIHKIKLVSTRVSIEKDFNINSMLTLKEQDFTDADYKWSKSSWGEIFSNVDIRKNEIDSSILSLIPRLPGTETSVEYYSGISFNDMLDVIGFTTENDLFLVFPSGKKVSMDVTQGKDPEYINIFSKKVLFNEIGTYKFFKGGDDIYPIATFDVYYNVTLISPDTTVRRLFNYTGNTIIDTAVAVPVGGKIALKLFVSDGKGNPLKNKSIGMYNIKTDSRGIATFDIQGKSSLSETLVVNGVKSNGRIYGSLYGRVYDVAKFDKSGKLLNSTVNGMKNIKIIYEGGSVYIPVEMLDIFVENGGMDFNKELIKTKEFQNGKYIDITSYDISLISVFSSRVTDEGVELYWLREMSF